MGFTWLLGNYKKLKHRIMNVWKEALTFVFCIHFTSWNQLGFFFFLSSARSRITRSSFSGELNHLFCLFRVDGPIAFYNIFLWQIVITPFLLSSSTKPISAASSFWFSSLVMWDSSFSITVSTDRVQEQKFMSYKSMGMNSQYVINDQCFLIFLS